MANGKIKCYYSEEEAQKLIEETDRFLVISGATISKAKEDIEKLKKKSNENIRSLSLLL